MIIKIWKFGNINFWKDLEYINNANTIMYCLSKEMNYSTSFSKINLQHLVIAKIHIKNHLPNTACKTEKYDTLG